MSKIVGRQEKNKAESSSLLLSWWKCCKNGCPVHYDWNISLLITPVGAEPGVLVTWDLGGNNFTKILAYLILTYLLHINCQMVKQQLFFHWLVPAVQQTLCSRSWSSSSLLHDIVGCNRQFSWSLKKPSRSSLEFYWVCLWDSPIMNYPYQWEFGNQM